MLVLRPHELVEQAWYYLMVCSSYTSRGSSKLSHAFAQFHGYWFPRIYPEMFITVIAYRRHHHWNP